MSKALRPSTPPELISASRECLFLWDTIKLLSNFFLSRAISGTDHRVAAPLAQQEQKGFFCCKKSRSPARAAESKRGTSGIAVERREGSTCGDGSGGRCAGQQPPPTKKTIPERIPAASLHGVWWEAGSVRAPAEQTHAAGSRGAELTLSTWHDGTGRTERSLGRQTARQGTPAHGAAIGGRSVQPSAYGSKLVDLPELAHG